jgi:uncharacterized membrane protein
VLALPIGTCDMDVAETSRLASHDVLSAVRSAARARSRLAVVARRVVYGSAAVYAVVFGAAAALHFYGFNEARLDLGDMVQAISSTAHGHFLQVTTPTGQQISRLGAHVDVFLVLLVPLWWISSSPLALLVLQAAAVASGALPAYWLARKQLGSERAGAHVAAGYLLLPATQFNAFTPSAGFHPVSFALPLLLYAIWFLDERRLVPFAVFALLAASTKEEIPAAIGCLGIWYALRKGERLAGATICAAGFTLSLVDFLVVVPHFSPSGVSPFADRYAGVGGTPTGILHNAVTDPAALLHAVATTHKLVYLLLLLCPFLGLFLLEPLLALGALPDLVINLLSAVSGQTTVECQYTAGIVPFLLAASVVGMKKLKGNPDRLSFYLLGGLAALSLYSPLFALGSDYRAVADAGAGRAAKVHALRLVPADAPVAASNQLAGYLSDRSFVSLFPSVRRASWVVVDRNDLTAAENHKRYLRAIGAIDSNPRWKVVYASQSVEVLRRVRRPQPRP